MPIKKSAIIFLLLTAGSFCLLAFTAEKTDSTTVNPARDCPVKCSFINHPNKAFSPWVIISNILFQQQV